MPGRGQDFQRGGAVPEAASGKAPVKKSRADEGMCSFSQTHGRAWVTTEFQCQKSKEENKMQVNEERRKGNGCRENNSLLCRSISEPFWLKISTLNSSLIYGT